MPSNNSCEDVDLAGLSGNHGNRTVESTLLAWWSVGKAKTRHKRVLYLYLSVSSHYNWADSDGACSSQSCQSLDIASDWLKEQTINIQAQGEVYHPSEPGHWLRLTQRTDHYYTGPRGAIPLLKVWILHQTDSKDRPLIYGFNERYINMWAWTLLQTDSKNRPLLYRPKGRYVTITAVNIPTLLQSGSKNRPLINIWAQWEVYHPSELTQRTDH